MHSRSRSPPHPCESFRENDGQQEFTTWAISDHPTHLVSVACGDLDGDGKDDIVAAGLHRDPPYHRLGKVSVWMNRGDRSR